MIYILLPVHNEEGNLPELFDSIRSLILEMSFVSFKVIICDDGSSDNSYSIIKKNEKSLDLIILRHEVNLGLGRTIFDLFYEAKKNLKPGDFCVRLDADASHDPCYIKDMYNKAIDDNFDIVVASRFQNNGNQIGVPIFRALQSRVANLVLKLIFPIRNLKDYTCAYRLYSFKALDLSFKNLEGNFIQLEKYGFTCSLEKIVKMNLLKMKFAEIPFTLRYDKKIGLSKMNSPITILGYINLVILVYFPKKGLFFQIRNINS